jgi:hypothetical protein
MNKKEPPPKRSLLSRYPLDFIDYRPKVREYRQLMRGIMQQSINRKESK